MKIEPQTDSKMEDEKSYQYFHRLSKLVTEMPHANWMKRWIEKSQNHKKNDEALKLISNDVGSFIDYAELIKDK